MRWARYWGGDGTKLLEGIYPPPSPPGFAPLNQGVMILVYAYMGHGSTKIVVIARCFIETENLKILID